jgi:transketolase
MCRLHEYLSSLDKPGVCPQSVQQSGFSYLCRMDFINRGDKPTKTGFGEAVLDAGRDDLSIIVLGADITASVGLDLFRNSFPERFFSMGIAEQNCAATAAGLALEGFKPVFSTYGVFAAHRAADQIRVSLCYNNLPVLIGGAHAGISVGPDGATHQALEDIAAIRVLPNMKVLSPCDATQTRELVAQALASLDGPVYVRFGREAVPDFVSPGSSNIGQNQLLKNGSDICLAATGHMVWHSLMAADILSREGIDAAVLNIHTIKPLNPEPLTGLAEQCGCVLTVEEHQIAAGFGSAVAELLVTHCAVPMDFVGVRDTFGESGKPEELMNKYGLTAEHIAEKARLLLKRK